MEVQEEEVLFKSKSWPLPKIIPYL